MRSKPTELTSPLNAAKVIIIPNFTLNLIENTNKMKKLIILLIALTLLIPAIAQQDGYNITIKLDGYTDSIGYLGNYYGDKLSVADTAVFRSGKIIFRGDEPLKQGIYFFVSQGKKKSFEFFITDDQDFELITAIGGPPSEMKIKGSEENDLFYAYLTENRNAYNQIKTLQSLIQAFPPENDSITLLKNQIDSLNKASIAFKLELMNENPESMLSLLFNLMREPEVPEFFSEDRRQDTLSAYLYYRKHYWDNVSLADDRILRTPVFYRKLDRYMNDVIPSHPDSIVTEIDQMMESTAGNTEMSDYLLWYFTNTYETSNVMGYDKVFVHMVDTYFTSTSYEWLHPVVQQNMIDRAAQLSSLLIGAYAPELIMADTNNKFIPLHQVEADYVIIIFWISTCSECSHEVDKLNELYESSDLDIKIYGINTDTTFSQWKSYINRKELDWVHVNGNISLTGDYHDIYDIYSTPVIYVLDKDKKIIAKRLSADKIPAILNRQKKVKTN